MFFCLTDETSLNKITFMEYFCFPFLSSFFFLNLTVLHKADIVVVIKTSKQRNKKLLPNNCFKSKTAS